MSEKEQDWLERLSAWRLAGLLQVGGVAFAVKKAINSALHNLKGERG